MSFKKVQGEGDTCEVLLTHSGWASDRVSFSSERAAIDFISNQLSQGRYYKGKSITGKLTAYNSAAYAARVQSCMTSIK